MPHYASGLAVKEGRQSLAAARDIELVYRPLPSAPDLPFEGDEELLRLMTLNRLNNAIAICQTGGSVSAELESRPDGVLLRISNTNMSIAPDAARHVFERFFCADKARSRENGGVELARQPGMGSVFTVTLPR